MNSPKFPHFKKIELHDKEVFDKYTKAFPLYSDFNFVSLWSWDIDEEIKFTFLNNNLVVELTDYLSNNPLLTFLGKNKVIETTETLLQYAHQKHSVAQLKLLPESNFSHININEFATKYHLKEDPNNFDYVLDIDYIAAMAGQKLKHKRKLLNRFLRNHGNKTIIKFMNINEVKKHLLDFYHHWSKNKRESDLNSNEFHAIKRLLQHYNYFNTTVMSAHIGERMIGFTLFEEISDDWALSSFQKGDISFEGIYEFLNYNLAIHLQNKKIKHVNIEQDLGIEGLRRAKKDYNPSYLKKFTLSRIS